MMRLARAYDPGEDAPFRRLATAVLKYWTCKRAPVHAAEALECLGGNGYVEEWGLARLYREAPLNSIWEGSGNVQCLDVLRAIEKSPESLAALFEEIGQARGSDARLDAFVRDLRADLGRSEDLEIRARRLVERLALALQASLLVRHAPREIADAFCASRLGGDGGKAFGTLPAGTDFGAILARALAV
jgi:putative acyl-CoA dehydrogenase